MAASSESVGSIISIFATAEALAATLTGAAIAGAEKYDAGKGLPPLIVRWVKAIQAQEQAHYEYLTHAGAKPLTLTFNIPDPKIATDTATLFKAIETLETAFIATYVAAAREFAAMKKTDIVKLALQTGGVEAEDRALARLALGEALPHNVAFPCRNAIRWDGRSGGAAAPSGRCRETRSARQQQRSLGCCTSIPEIPRS